MIAFRHQSLQDFIKSSSPKAPTQEEIKRFATQIESFLQKATLQSDEEFQKNEINKFLAQAYGYDCNTKGRVDSAVYVEGEAQVLIEAKALNNKTEFPTSMQHPLSKALCEAILYFLRESQTNNSLKHIILCNPYEFYIFDATRFDVFFKDKTIKKLYKNCDGKEGVDKSTKRFYTDLQTYLSGEFEGELPYTHFSLKNQLSTQELTSIYQLLSPQVLLKARKTLDANTLNKKFYEELLYILGLQEVSEGGKSGGKILITPSKIPNTLSSEISRHYGVDDESTFTLITTWNNRILFLRLLESMLLSFGHIQKPFLDTSIIKDFKTLQTLFFEVLAKKIEERSPSLPKEFLNIPYLNSSLFDPIALEQEGKNIDGLDSYKVALFPRSVLKGSYKEGEGVALLEYLFEFLHAYDFTTTPKDITEGTKKNHDKLINSAVLGLVFEKLNGYKEGSFYTPSFITSYMSKQSITQATLEKFNSTFGWECESLRDIITYSRADKVPQNSLLSTLLSLRICDPACGSGHFLVSALNEMVFLCYELGLLTSFKTNTILELENDEILIKNGDEIFAYSKPSSPSELSHQIQKELFNLKKSIIENCLFGVDINPNSCEITKLRLWIELLKYSYYIFDESGKNTNALETLPNIDINIKCGNSLISNFPLDSNLTIGQTKSFSKNLKTKIQNYKDSVMLYKEGLGEKTKILQDIANVKATIISYLVEKNPAKLELKDSLQAFIRDYDKEFFDPNTNFGIEMLKIARDNNYKFTATLTSLEPAPLDKTAHKLLEKIQKSYEALENLKTSNAFEWRFEFPEVLDDEGNFLGFDVVIGNPPYVSIKEIDNDSKKFYLAYHTATGQYDLYVLFLERALALIANNGLCSLITSSTYFSNKDMKSLRLLLLQQTNIQKLLYLGEDIFESATQDVAIIEYKKKKDRAENFINITRERKDFEEKRFDKISQDVFLHQEPYNFSFRCSSEKLKMIEKYFIKNCSPKLNDLCCISRGIEIGGNSPLITTKVSQGLSRIIVGRDIKRYFIDNGDKYIRFDDKDKAIFKEEDIYKKPKILIQRIRNLRYTDRIVATYDESGLFCTNTLRILNARGNANLKLILGILNSSFINFYFFNFYFNKDIYAYQLESIPIPEVTESNQSTADKIIALVEEILKTKEQDPNALTQELESQIDSLVYTLYNLTDEEIKIIENKE